ncbi:uncharacterized membrane protein YhaH (DUF805 family) [Dysgonomonas sp. PFB1-18]|uniref:hypothetical protein n=1 Tax=unclassified Dysgonomonas TaxID=2630389 RepID=UPI002476319C|nr:MULTISPECIES: hypothetical protein [unclassified Dysgonomonas]MDH6310400.1 uncharacterized membrane protein YhaH (DUF805 family) [Dysgonomonas sp. PF1-14]MDH6340270.1 uncharacterized membrane protein YhaH (DUF805 family) [Dysgonomonas sp. PF1-16]MDH6381950.1 uncharacterized membrane protein YhaH (DUF805 family) [Dysgonomonas sp. PFB1-18]MDH6399241.1 uncharacterized membrane protein YhaH (DUF805 family) [Dysgonomonas sp. PF1-23]
METNNTMIENKFFRMLFDYRGSITRRQYWGSLLFLLIMLSTNNLIYRWESLGGSLGFIRNIPTIYDGDTYLFLIQILGGLMTILYFTSTAVAFSLIFVTLKRCRALGYAKVIGWVFAIITYASYFLLNALSKYAQYKSTSARSYGGDASDLSDVDMVIPTGFIITGIFIVATIIIVILLSRQADVDNEEEVDYDAYDSISCIFGLTKFFLAYTAVFICFKLMASWLAYNPTIAKLAGLAAIVAYVYFYLKIFVKRSRDAGINSAFIIVAFFSLVALIGFYIFTLATGFFDDKPVMYLFSNRFFYVLMSVYFIFSYVIIALPSKREEEV